MSKTITIFGGSSGSGVAAGSQAYEEARRLGRRLAEAGFRVCNGGYGGTMEAAARGAKEAGGSTIGVTLALFDRLAPNRYIDDERRAPDFFVRLRQLITLGDGCVCLRGGVGTLTEFSLTWTLLQTGAISPRPLVCVGHGWRAVLDTYRQATLIRPKDFDLVTAANSVDEAVDYLKSRLA